MEFPELGQNCSETLCKRLDFLPMKCDACNQIFCKDHIQYSKHTCQNAYWKDVQVPVCPLCNAPVPVKRGEPPDIKVGEHIDRDCQSDPAIAKRKIYTNKCSLKGCKQKELIPVKCDQCLQNFCLKHRHTADHQCQGFQGSRHPLSQAGAASITRSQQQAKKDIVPKKHNPASLNHTQTVATTAPLSQNHPACNRNISHVPVASVQGELSEDEALALALHQSLQGENIPLPSPNSSALKNLQEEEDRMLAQALADSEREATARQQQKDRGKSNCIIS